MGLSRLARNLPHARRLQNLDLSASAATVAIQQVEESSALAGAVRRRHASSVDGLDDRSMPTCGEGVEYRHGWDMLFEEYDWEHTGRSRMYVFRIYPTDLFEMRIDNIAIVFSILTDFIGAAFPVLLLWNVKIKIGSKVAIWLLMGFGVV